MWFRTRMLRGVIWITSVNSVTQSRVVLTYPPRRTVEVQICRRPHGELLSSARSRLFWWNPGRYRVMTHSRRPCTSAAIVQRGAKVGHLSLYHFHPRFWLYIIPCPINYPMPLNTWHGYEPLLLLICNISKTSEFNFHLISFIYYFISYKMQVNKSNKRKILIEIIWLDKRLLKAKLKPSHAVLD